MVDAGDVAAVVVTRGNVDLTEILDSLSSLHVVVWDNSVEPVDLKVYGRYAGIARCDHPYIYVQDDDCVVPVEKLLELYRPGDRISNMGEPATPGFEHFALMGFGAVFPRAEPFLAFEHWFAWTGRDRHDPEFLLRCDTVYSAILPFRRVHEPHRNLPWASAPDRIWTGEPGHRASRERILGRALSLPPMRGSVRGMSTVGGGCVCGGVRYEVTLPFRRASTCHCSRCRKHSGSIGLVQGRVARERFRLLQGEELIRVWAPEDGGAVKAFCSECGSSLFGNQWPEGEEISIRLGTLDDDPEIRPSFHSFAEEVPPWDALPEDGLPRFPGAHEL